LQTISARASCSGARRGVVGNTGSLATTRYGHTATLLPNGKVLVAGADGSPLAERGTLRSSQRDVDGHRQHGHGTYLHTATQLPNGKVLVVGGYAGSSSVANAELYDPASGTWTTTGSLTTARRYHTATLLPNGKVLVAGGYGSSYRASAELYDPASGTWATTSSLAHGALP